MIWVRFYLFCTWVKGKAPAAMCVETLVSLQLSVWAPAAVCIGLEGVVLEDVKDNKTLILKNYLCICV